MSYWKKSTLFLIAFNLLWVAGGPALRADDKVFIGEIADTPCAMNVHSTDKTHTEMLKVQGVGKTSTDCALYCVKNRGGRFALETKHSVYRLDNQELAEGFAGRKVRVTGTLDAKSGVIQVSRIDPLPESKK